jgi:hypothetical protein
MGQLVVAFVIEGAAFYYVNWNLAGVMMPRRHDPLTTLLVPDGTIGAAPAIHGLDPRGLIFEAGRIEAIVAEAGEGAREAGGSRLARYRMCWSGAQSTWPYGGTRRLMPNAASVSWHERVPTVRIPPSPPVRSRIRLSRGPDRAARRRFPAGFRTGLLTTQGATTAGNGSLEASSL